MSDYIISQISPSDTRANKQINELLLAEGIRRDANLDYTCGMYDNEMNIIATGLFWQHTPLYGSQQRASGRRTDESDCNSLDQRTIRAW